MTTTDDTGLFPVVYFSNVTEFTHRLVLAVCEVDTRVRAFRIPARAADPVYDPHPQITDIRSVSGGVGEIGHHVLLMPTYGGSLGNVDQAMLAKNPRHIPRQVGRWMRDNGPKGRLLTTGVFGTGNVNFGVEFCAGATELAEKLNVPVLGRYDLIGDPEDHVEFVSRLERFTTAYRQATA